jgi:serine/threonine-protein kinase
VASVLYELLTGEPPHTGATVQAIIMKIVTEDAAPVTRVRKSVPPNVTDALTKALERLPADRFTTAAEFAEALQSPAFRLAGSAREAAAVPAMATSWRLLAVAAIAVATLSVALGWLLAQNRADPIPVEQQRIVLGDGPERIPEMIAFRATLHPTGEGIIFGDAIEDATTRMRVTAWWKSRTGIDATAIPTMDGALTPTFSPNGQWVAFVLNGQLRKQPLSGGTSITLVDGVSGGTAHALAWMDDDTIVFENSGYVLERIDANGRGIPDTVSVEARTGQPIHMSGLPGGWGVLVSACVNSCPAGTQLSLLDLEADSVIRLAENVVRAWPAPRGHVIYLTRDGGVFAAALDRGTRTLGPPTPLFENVRVSSDANGEMHIAPDGQALFVRGQASTASFRPTTVNRDGRSEAIIGPATGPQSYLNVAVSPDGRRLAFTIVGSANTGQQIWVSEVGGGPLLPLTPNETNAGRPAWMDGGSRVAYVSSAGARHIRSVRSDGTSTTPDTLATGMEFYEVLSTRSGDSLLVRVNGVQANADIRLVPPGSAEASVPLLDSPFSESAVTLSPDGRWIAYVSNVSGTYEVYVRPFPDVTGGQTPISQNGGVEPLWGPDGREIFYRDGDGWLVTASVAEDASGLKVEQRTRLFDARNYATDGGWRAYDVLPGGERFVMLQPGPGGMDTGDLVLMEDIFRLMDEALER